MNKHPTVSRAMKPNPFCYRTTLLYHLPYFLLMVARTHLKNPTESSHTCVTKLCSSGGNCATTLFGRVAEIACPLLDLQCPFDELLQMRKDRSVSHHQRRSGLPPAAGNFASASSASSANPMIGRCAVAGLAQLSDDGANVPALGDQIGKK
jgi:hypothetical protein